VDGDITTMTGTLAEVNSYWQVDLGDVYRIALIVIAHIGVDSSMFHIHFEAVIACS